MSQNSGTPRHKYPFISFRWHSRFKLKLNEYDEILSYFEIKSNIYKSNKVLCENSLVLKDRLLLCLQHSFIRSKDNVVLYNSTADGPIVLCSILMWDVTQNKIRCVTDLAGVWKKSK